MKTAALSTEHTLYYQLRNDGRNAVEISLEDGAELTHMGETPDDVLVLLKKINAHASTAQGSHLTIQVCGQTPSSAHTKTPLHLPPSVTIGVMKLPDSLLLGEFNYFNVFMNNPRIANDLSDSQVLCAIDSPGIFWDVTQDKIKQLDMLRFFDTDVVTLLATYSAQELSFSLAINGVVKPLFCNYRLTSPQAQRHVSPFFFIQFNNISLKVVGNIASVQASLPNPKKTFSLFSHYLQNNFTSNLITPPLPKIEPPLNEPPGLCAPTPPLPGMSATTTIAFSSTPQQPQQVVLSSEKLMYKHTASKPSPTPAVLPFKPTTSTAEQHMQFVQSAPPVWDKLTGVRKPVELSNIYGFGKQMGNHTVCADESTIYVEVDLGALNVSANQKPIQQYNFSTTATESSLENLDASQFSLAVFSLVKTLGSLSSMVINTRSSDLIKPNVRLICVHKEVLKALPLCALFPILLSSNVIEPEIPSIRSSGLYDFLVSENGVEMQSHRDGTLIKIDRFILRTFDNLSQFFDKDFYEKMVSLESNLVSDRPPLDLQIGSYVLCISINTACISVLQHTDERRTKVLASMNNAQVQSWFSLSQLSTPLAWHRVAEVMYRQMPDNASYSNGFRFLRNTLGFMGFIDLSYRIATIDTEGVAITTPIPLADHRLTTTNALETPVSICGVSMPKGCTLQLVTYDISRDRKLGGHKNIAQDYFLNPPGKSSYLDYSTFNRGVYQSEAIKTYEFLYENVFAKKGDKRAADNKAHAMDTALKHTLSELLSLLDTHHDLLDAAASHLSSPDYLYDVFISRELDRVQSPVRSSVIRHACSFHTDIRRIDASIDSVKNSIDIWNKLKSIVEAGLPFWIFFDEITNVTKSQSEAHEQDFVVTNNSPSFNGREFIIVAHRVGARILYVLYADGTPVQTVLTAKPINIMLAFDSPWAMNSKYYLCKSPVYSPNYLRLTSWKECFQKPIPFTPYLPSHLEMIPLTSSLNLEMGSSMLSNSNSSAESLSLYNNAANKMSHWESLLFVGSNSLVTPQTTNIYISIYSPYHSDDDNLSILHHSLVRQYGSKSPRGSYEEGNYISLVASQYRQRVSSHVGLHSFSNRSSTRRLDIDTTMLNLSKKDIEKAPKNDHVLNNISMYRLGKAAKAELLANITNQYYMDGYKFDGVSNPLLEDKSIERLKKSIHAPESYRFSWQDLKASLGGLYEEPILLFLCMGHCIDYTHMFNTEELFYGENDTDTIVWNLLLLIFGGGNIYKPCIPVVNFLINGINERATRLQSPTNPELLMNGNVGPIKRPINPKTLLDISFPPNILRDEYRSFYNYDKLCYAYASNAFEAYHFGESLRSVETSQDTRVTSTVSLAPTCNPPASVYVRFEYIYVPRISTGSIDEILLHESERVNKVIDDLHNVASGQDDNCEASFPQFELVNTATSKPLYASFQRTNVTTVVPYAASKSNRPTMQLSNKPTTSFVPSVDGNSNKDINREMNMYTVSNNGYAVDATNLDICVLLSEMLPNRPLYSHCLKVVVRFQGKYGRFMIDRYSSTFSCARFTGDDRTKKKYMEMHGEMRVTVILDYKQMFIFMFLQDLLSNSQTNAQRVPWKINWPVRFMVLLHHASAEITTLEN